MKLQLPPLKVTREGQPEWQDTSKVRVVNVGPVRVGEGLPVIMAGPCAVESREQTLAIARAVAAAGGRILRGGAFKPRTNPRSFQGLGREGLEILAEARAETGLPFVTEALDPRSVDLVADYADAIQVGSRNMQNFPLLTAVGQTGKPVLLKRGFGSTVSEWLQAAEYIAEEGNLNIMLCERGIRTMGNGEYDRATLDLAAVDVARRLTPFPVIVDPSHAAGRYDLVATLALAGLCTGAHGLIIEVIASGTDRSQVLCDGEQGIEPPELERIVRATSVIAGLLS